VNTVQRQAEGHLEKREGWAICQMYVSLKKIRQGTAERAFKEGEKKMHVAGVKREKGEKGQKGLGWGRRDLKK